MNLLGKNQYSIWYSDRCNYKCTYCCNNASPRAPKSAVESNPEALIKLFNQVDPGVILVSGGEPSLWKNFPVVLDGLPQHNWVILTNLSFVPDWFQHPNIKLLIPAFHEEFAQPDRFTEHLAELRRLDKRHHVKLIVKPDHEYAQVPLWDRWNGEGSFTSFVPLEYTFHFKRAFLQDVIDQFRTCCLYNARFFRADSPMNVQCAAGSKQAFQVNSDGRLVRCSTVFEPLGESGASSISAANWNAQPKFCDRAGCYCEWHHWGQMALANDNETWTHFIETGIWRRPSRDELHSFIRQMRWDPAGRNTEGSRVSLFPPLAVAKANDESEADERRLTLSDVCAEIQSELPTTNEGLFGPFGLLDGHSWAKTASDPITSYYACLYGVAQREQPRKVLEIGTAFGMSAATFLTASPGIELFVSLDLGIYGEILGGGNNIDFARERIHGWCRRNKVDTNRVRFFRANTQPAGAGDNDGQGQDAPRWHLIPEVVRLLQEHEFDIIFVDGKHTDDGLLKDLETFWPLLKPGGLAICDDLHEPHEYANTFSWVGHTWRSYHTFLNARQDEIAEHVLWNFPRVPPAGKLGLRPFGLIRKSPLRHPVSQSPQFEMFDTPGALEINLARQDHLASLGLDLAGQRVLEVGAGVGWHTAFFEKLGCEVVSTDARPESVAEMLRRYPHRQGRVFTADLNVPESHAAFGRFDAVYCYGTLYHLSDPALCLAELAARSSGLLLIETCVHPSDNGRINLAAENRDNPNQSFHGQGCGPGRDWIMAELRKHFPHVYVTRTQPAHPDYPNRWPAQLPQGVQNSRAVFVASRTKLDLPTLLSVLPSEQPSLECALTPPLLASTEPNPSVSPTGRASDHQQGVSSVRNDAASDAAVAASSAEVIRARIGRMLQQSEPISERELAQATEALALLFQAKNPIRHIEQYRCLFPPAMFPLFSIYLAEAWNLKNEPLATAMEEVYAMLATPAETLAAAS